MATTISETEQQITLDKLGEVYIITFTGSPHKANIFNIPLLLRLGKLLDVVEDNAPCSLIIIGSGKFYSAGFDLKALTGTAHRKNSNGSQEGATHGQQPQGQELVWVSWSLLARLLVFPVPTISVFNGHAFGLGLFLGLACDHRIMMVKNKKSFLCLPEITIGLPLGEGFAALAKCKLNPVALKNSALTGKKWTCIEALKYGIVDAVVPSPKSLAAEVIVPTQALELAESLVSTSEKGNLSIIKMEIYGETYGILSKKRRSKL